jgi:hypothetical protein
VAQVAEAKVATELHLLHIHPAELEQTVAVAVEAEVLI